MRISPPELLLLTEGIYSDTVTHGPFRVLVAFEQRVVHTKYLAQLDGESPTFSGFIGWLCSSGYIEDVPSSLWHLGDYELDPENIDPENIDE